MVLVGSGSESFDTDPNSGSSHFFIRIRIQGKDTDSTDPDPQHCSGKSCFVTTRLSFFACQKDAAGAALKKAAPALGSSQQKNRLQLPPKSGGSGSATLLRRAEFWICNTGPKGGTLLINILILSRCLVNISTVIAGKKRSTWRPAAAVTAILGWPAAVTGVLGHPTAVTTAAGRTFPAAVL